MYEIVETWTSAKGYSFKEGFGMMLFVLGIAIFQFCIVIIFFPFSIVGVLGSIPFLAFLIGMISVVWYMYFRNQSKENNWHYRDYLTNIDLWKEKGKNDLLKKIHMYFKDKSLKFDEVSYDSRFPLHFVNSYKIENKVQLDIFCRGIPEESKKKVTTQVLEEIESPSIFN